MSYTRHFSKTVAVRYSGTVSYPASQSGGTCHYSGTAYETVHINIHVDTDPFDNQVDSMKHRVDLLTGSVVATQAAHVAAKEEASHKIGDTIVKGFFKTVQSDISQQITELKNNTDALLIQLNKLAGQCNDKRRQMGVDYQRIVARYAKVFEDLNNELENRIYSIDEPVFRTTRKTDEAALKGMGTDMVSVASVSASENAHAASRISASLLKNRALEAIDKGKRFLEVQYHTDALLDQCLRQGGEAATYTVPCCLIEATTGAGYTMTNLYTSPMLENVNRESIRESIQAQRWKTRVPEQQCQTIADYFNAEVANKMLTGSPDKHTRRVAEMTSKLFNLSKTDAPGK